MCGSKVGHRAAPSTLSLHSTKSLLRPHYKNVLISTYMLGMSDYKPNFLDKRIRHILHFWLACYPVDGAAHYPHLGVSVCVCESAVFILFLEHSFYTPNSHVVIYSADVLTLSLSTKHCAVTIISNKMTWKLLGLWCSTKWLGVVTCPNQLKFRPRFSKVWESLESSIFQVN